MSDFGLKINLISYKIFKKCILAIAHLNLELIKSIKILKLNVSCFTPPSPNPGV